MTINEWVVSVPEYAGMTADEQTGLVELATAFEADKGRLPMTAAEAMEWIATPVPVVVVTPLTVEEEAARKAAVQAELEAAQEAATAELTKVAKTAGKKLLAAETAATVANVVAGRLIRDGIKAYLVVYPRSRQAAEQIVVGKLAEATGASYKVSDLVEFAGIADVFGEDSEGLAMRKFRELAKLVEKTEDGEGWQFLPGIAEGAMKLLGRATGASGKKVEVIPLEQWKADIMVLCRVAEGVRAQALKAESATKTEEAKKLGDTAEATILRTEAEVNRLAAEAAEKREQMWAERIDRTTATAAQTTANKALAVAQKAVGQTPSVVSQANPSQARDVALSWITDLSKTADTATRLALAVQLIGGDMTLLGDVIAKSTGKAKPEQMGEMAHNMLDDAQAIVELMGWFDEAQFPAVMTGIQTNTELRKAVGKRFGAKEVKPKTAGTATDAIMGNAEQVA